VSGTSLLCSNPDALGVDNTEKDIFDPLNTIAQLPPSSSKVGDHSDNSAIRMAGSPAIEDTGQQSPVTGTGE